jgi:glycosyltransferase involved in cell wall biosynthesis
VKVLYVAHYREDSGWGDAARNYILAMDKVGIDVVCRPIIFQNNAILPDRIKELERKSYPKYDFCIQNVLPHHFEWSNAYKAVIGQFVTETVGIRHTSWASKIKMMDGILFPHKDTSFGFRPKNVGIIPHALDTEDLLKKRQPLEINEIKDKFTFYYIGEFNRRKNIGAILRAFHTEFRPNEPVSLVLKVNKPGVSPNQLGFEVNNFCNEIKSGLRLYSNLDTYNQEVLICHRLSREDLIRLHYTCNCFVTSSFGEASCIPAHEAAIVGNQVVAPDYGPFRDLRAVNCNTLLVNCSIQPLIAGEKTFPGFATAKEKWHVTDVADLAYKMRVAFNTFKGLKDDSHISFSYENIGDKILAFLEDLT